MFSGKFLLLSKMNEQKRKLLILTVICACTILPFLGLTEYNTKGEPREAIVAYSMLESGNWILPRNYGGDIAFKPPFFHWSIAAVSGLWGKVTEVTSRIPSALALIIMALSVYWFYAKRKTPWIALLTAGISLTCFEVHRAGFAARVDMVLTAFIVLALLRFYHWYERGCKGIPWLAVVFMSCATLTKGPVGIILPCLVTGVFLWIREGRFWKWILTFAGIALLACVLPAIWYVLAYQQGGDQFLDLMMEENFGRFMGKMSYKSHENPAIYNVMMIIAGYLPWTLLALFSLFGLRYRKPDGTLSQLWQRLVEKVKKSDPVDLFSFLSATLIFIFYCIPASKRGVYLLPVYPFVGYFLAVYFLALVRKGSKAVKAFGIFMSIVVGLLTVVFLLVRAGVVPDSIFVGKHAAENIDFLHALESVPLDVFHWILILLPVAAILYWWRIRKRQANEKGLWALCLLLFSVFVSLDGVYQPAVLNVKTDKYLAEKVREYVPEGKIYSYEALFYSVNFYNGNRMALFEKENPSEGILMVGQKKYQQLMENFGHEYLFEKLYDSPRRSCDTRDIVYVLRFTKKETLIP